MAVAIFDLDRTLTKYATYTPFLIFAAFHRAPWRLLLLPVWLVSMIGYGLRVFSRKRLKEIGFLLLVGRGIASGVTLPTSSTGHSIPATADITPEQSGAATCSSRNHCAARKVAIATTAAMIR